MGKTIAITSSLLSLLCIFNLLWLPSSTRIQNILCNNNSTASKSSTTYSYQNGNNGGDKDINATSISSSSSSWVVPHYDFPSVEERFRYYMGSWYNITDYTISDCSILIEGGTRSRDQFFNKDFIFHIDTFKSCSNHSDRSTMLYCKDAYNTLRHGIDKTYFEDFTWYDLPAHVQAAATTLGYSQQLWDSDGANACEELFWKRLTEDQRHAATILGYNEQSWNDDRSQDTADNDEDMLLGDIAAVFNLGDLSDVQNPKTLPVISKARRAISELNSIAKSSQQQIIWPLNTFRHYHQLEQYHANIKEPWEDKLSTIVWRGKPTGSPHHPSSDSERSRVQLIQRWIHYNPNIVDIAFSSIAPQIIGYQGEYMKKHSIRKTMKIENMTRYKYLLSIEGNDVGEKETCRALIFICLFDYTSPLIFICLFDCFAIYRL